MKQKYVLKGPNKVRKTSGIKVRVFEKIKHQQDDVTN